MSRSTQPKTRVRVVNGLAALSLGALVLAMGWPTIKLADLSRADLQYQGEWIGGHAKRVTAVTPGGVADRAGLKVGDVLEFDPSRNEDWVLAAYRNMPPGFRATLSARHSDGTRSVVTLAPDLAPYLPTLNDRLSLLAFLCGSTIFLLLGVFLVAALPSLMTWSLLVASFSSFPYVPWWGAYFVAYRAGGGVELSAILASLLVGAVVAFIPFALCFPRNTVAQLVWWKQALGCLVLVAGWAFISAGVFILPFENDGTSPHVLRVFASTVVYLLCYLAAIGILAHTYRRSNDRERARLRWVLLGFCAAIGGAFVAIAGGILPFTVSGQISASALTPTNWALAFIAGVFIPSALGMAVLRGRVVDIQFAISRTVVYGAVSTIVLVFLAVLHWLLGRMIEHSGLAVGLEGLAAVGLGLVLHRASHGISRTVDRVLFRQHHAAEERLRQVTAALPFASTEQSIAEAIVEEPARNLKLASAALFYRESAEDPLRRVRAVGWGESQAATLDGESLLVRYLQAEHAALRIDDEQEWLPTGMPEGAAHPVLAIPIVTQQVLTAVVLYGAHLNSTLPDPDEVVLLEALAKAAATSHSQVRIATLMRETESQQRRIDQQQERIGHLEETTAELRELVRVRLSGVQGAG